MDASLPHERLRRTADGLADRSVGLVLVPVAPVVLTAALVTALLAVRGFGDTELAQLEAYALYSLPNLLVAAGVLAGLDRPALLAAVPLRRPSPREVAAALVAFPVGLGVYQVATASRTSWRRWRSKRRSHGRPGRKGNP
jgi:hypothetical protein